jgi:hypothetical protein
MTPNSPALYDWQEEHAEKLCDALRHFGSAMDGSDTGTGKTVIALEVARRLDLIPFVVCPKAVIPTWKEWMKRYRPHDPLYFAFTYEKMRGGTTSYLLRKKKMVSWRLQPSMMLLIFDEVHRCKGAKTLNSKMLAQAKDAGVPTLMLSATACFNPVDMKAIGYQLEMHNYRHWWNWCLKTGCRKGHFGGLQFNNSRTVLKSIHNYIYPAHGSRIRIKELPPGTFPDNLVIPEGYHIDDPDKLDAIYGEMATELAALAEKVEDDSGESALTIQLRARQETELLKVPTFTELARDAFEEGNSVVIFVNFIATLDALIERMPAMLPDGSEQWSEIRGGQSDEDRQDNVDRFQKNESRICLSMIQAGGVGLNLHDEHGEHPRVSLISPSFSAIEFRQTLGRIHRAGGKSPAIQKIVFAAGTVEMRVCRAVRGKLNNLDLINDDELNPIL